jgi:hypothetical protein
MECSFYPKGVEKLEEREVAYRFDMFIDRFDDA